jgi:nicotinamide riboside transporter PnuC
LVISIVAMLFATFYIRQQWIMWFISNVSTISLWLVNVIEFTESQNLSMLLVSSFTLYTYCFSFVNSIFGYRNWRKNEAKSQNIVNLN